MRQILKKLFVLPLILFFFQSRAQSDEDEFNVGLADKIEETGLVKKGQWQLEAGYLHSVFKTGSPAAIGQFYVRYGLSEHVEFRLLTEQGSQIYRYMDETVQSTFPLAAGIKIKILQNHAFLPDMSLVGNINVPVTATSKMPKEYWAPLLFMAFQHKLSKKFSIDYNAGAQQAPYRNTWSALFNVSLHFKFTDDLEISGEYFSQYQPEELPQHNVGTGITYSLSKHVALYVAGGSSIFYKEGNHFFTGGVAVRFPE